MSENWLLLDTACPRGLASIAALNPSPAGGRGQGEGGRSTVLSEIFLDDTKKHAENLPSAIDQALTLASIKITDLKGIAVGTGPGSFIGVRIAIAQAKGMCMALQIPLVGVSTLVAILLGEPPGNGMAIIDARRNEFYAIEAPGSEPKILTPAQVQELSETKTFVTGFGHPAVNREQLGPTANGLLKALQLRLESGLVDETLTLLPQYLRAAVGDGPSR